jgi:hypothetical protein
MIRSVTFLVVAAAAITSTSLFAACSSSSGGSGNGSGPDAASSSSGGGSGGGSGSSSGGGSDGGSGSSSGGGTTSEAGTGDAGDGAVPDPFECTVPATPPSGGSCVTVLAGDAGFDGGTGIQCNPVTNDGCSTGEECDINGDSSGNLIGFVCYPPPNTATACQSCDPTGQTGPTCVGGFTCPGLNTAGTAGYCAKYCCTNADCGSGTCTTMSGGTAIFGPIATSLGVCTM